MNHIKCLNVPAKGFEVDIEDALSMGDLVSIPVEEDDHQKYEHYKVVGFIADKWLLCHADPQLTNAANDG
jgi:hypothetical protein